MALIDEINAGTPRQTVITFPDGDHEDIMSGFKSGSIELEEILCDGESLLFGGCASNMFGCCLISDDILGKKIKVYQKIGEYTQDIFTGYVDSFTETNERTYHKLIAYDSIKRHGADNVAEWYNSLWESKSEYTLKEFRDSFFEHLGVLQVDVELVNDNMTITKTISGESISAISIMKAICEINGVFGNINRQGLFDYVSLSNTSKGYAYRSGDSAFESYSCNPITRVRVIEDEDDVGAVVGQYGNTYTVCGNILTLGTGTEERASIADKLLTKIYGITYRPADMVGVISNPTIQLGDKLTVDVNGVEASTYVLKNRMYGVQLFSQRLESEGVEMYSETDIDVNTEIQRIKSKQLKITKTVEEFKTEVVDGVRDAQSIAKQTADKMEWIVKEVEGEEESSFEITDEAIEATTKKLLITTPDGKTVLIEGGKMLIDEIFAQAITATGSITGAKLIGASGEFEGDVASYDTITMYTGYTAYLPDGTTQYVKDAGKIIFDVSGDSNVQGAAPARVYLTIDSHSDKAGTAIIRLTQKNGVTLKQQDSSGLNGTYIQFGESSHDNTRLTIKPQFTYKTSKELTTVESINSPLFERIMAEVASMVQGYIENLTVSNTLLLPDEIWSDAKTHVAMITSSGELTTSTINSTELYRLLGATSNVQDQINKITTALAKKYENSGYKTVSMSSGTLTNIASVVLSAGTWLVVGGIRYTPGTGATLSTTELSMHTNTTNMNTNPTNYVKQQESGLSSGTSALNATTLVTVSADTTYYLNGRVYTSGATAATSAYGRLFAIKIPEM